MKRRFCCIESRIRMGAGLVTLLITFTQPPSMSAGPASSESAGASETAARAGMTWKGPNGEALPFENNDEVKEFLRTAQVIEMEEIPDGVTDPRRALLEKDGIQVRAIFRDVDISRRVGPGRSGKRRLNFRDCYIFEAAAYEVAEMLGLDNVPPVVLRKIEGTNGSLQIWVEDCITEKSMRKDGITPASPWHHAMQHQIMKIFDNLICNEDRHQGNLLYDENWKLWMIDHSRTFRMDRELPRPEYIKLCEKDLWEKLQTLDETELVERLDDLLKDSEIKGLLERRIALVDHIQKLIEEKGEKGALFTYYEPRRVSP